MSGASIEETKEYVRGRVRQRHQTIARAKGILQGFLILQVVVGSILLGWYFLKERQATWMAVVGVVLLADCGFMVGIILFIRGKCDELEEALRDWKKTFDVWKGTLDEDAVAVQKGEIGVKALAVIAVVLLGLAFVPKMLVPALTLSAVMGVAAFIASRVQPKRKKSHEEDRRRLEQLTRE